ncbi:tetratricopeptide repeat protein [Streptomyces sp. IBSBF 2435]|uniref:tetratricopeptide repeat protein n=1 Tax=Streptomyces sp. IBSBF 2435 TaxID=2903531 RepID=UPI002FDC7A6F
MTAAPDTAAPSADWERRNADLWTTVGNRPDEEFRAAMDALVGELPEGDSAALFERAAAWDSTGHSDRAVPLYRAALDARVGGERRRRAVIQLASSLRNLGRSQESVALLIAERAAGHDHLDDALAAVLALALTDVGREREAVSVAVGALAPHLPRYQRSMANYARLLVEPDLSEPDPSDPSASSASSASSDQVG